MMKFYRRLPNGDFVEFNEYEYTLFSRDGGKFDWFDWLLTAILAIPALVILIMAIF